MYLWLTIYGGWFEGTTTTMDISPRVERFTTVTAGDGSAIFIICLSHTRCLSTSPLVFVNTTTMWDPDIYRWYMLKLKQKLTVKSRKKRWKMTFGFGHFFGRVLYQQIPHVVSTVQCTQYRTVYLKLVLQVLVSFHLSLKLMIVLLKASK